MALTQRTTWDCIELWRDGSIAVRFQKRTLNGNVTQGDPQVHRLLIDPGMDVDERVALANADLASTGWMEPISPDDVPEIRKIVGAYHTPERLERFLEIQRIRFAALGIG